MTTENDKRKGELSAFDKAIRLCEIAKLRAALEASEARIKELEGLLSELGDFILEEHGNKEITRMLNRIDAILPVTEGDK